MTIVIDLCIIILKIPIKIPKMHKRLTTKPLILLILDGWGYSSKYHGNAVKQAYTPNLDFLWHHYPNALLNASGEHVGLPEEQMGNSEVGHTTIGSGRVINQELVRIGKAIKTGNFFKHQLLQATYKQINSTKNKIHLVGLCSDGGVHSHIKHLLALIQISKQYKNLETCIHIITDGRDTEPQNAQKFINQIQEHINSTSNINICTISGRYYSMDRDCRWSRTEKAYNCLTQNIINHNYFQDIQSFLKDSYKKRIYDEFILPTRVYYGAIDEGDCIIFFNFRPDRMRQLVQSFCMTSFKNFKIKSFSKLNIITFTTYDSTLSLPVVFPKINQNNFLGQIVSENGLKQLRIAETEKYAHVTYFFNGGREEPFSGENRLLIASPSTDLYDKTPEMSAHAITDKIIEAIKHNTYDIIIANYANPDMIGHTGNFSATQKSIEIVDKYLATLLNVVKNYEITIMITADHGNAEEMFDRHNQPCKSHTNNLVPLILIPDTLASLMLYNHYRARPIGSLADIAPTILDLLDIDIPSEMNGKSLIKKLFNPIKTILTGSSFSGDNYLK